MAVVIAVGQETSENWNDAFHPKTQNIETNCNGNLWSRVHWSLLVFDENQSPPNAHSPLDSENNLVQH